MIPEQIEKIRESKAIYRPKKALTQFFVDKGTSHKEIDKILIYSKDGEILYEFRHFIDEPSFLNYPKELNYIGFEEKILRRNKEKFDGKLFFIPLKRVYRYENDKCLLYIPIETLEIEKVDERVVGLITRSFREGIFKIKLNYQLFYFISNIGKYFQTLENKKEDKVEQFLKKMELSEYSSQLQYETKKIKMVVDKIIEIREMNEKQLNNLLVFDEL